MTQNVSAWNNYILTFRPVTTQYFSPLIHVSHTLWRRQCYVCKQYGLMSAYTFGQRLLSVTYLQVQEQFNLDIQSAIEQNGFNRSQWYTYNYVMTSLGSLWCSKNLKPFCQSIAYIHLTLSKTTNFKLFQTERVCRRQFQIWW